MVTEARDPFKKIDRDILKYKRENTEAYFLSVRLYAFVVTVLGRSPKIAVPTRTQVDPSAIATSKS
jgi:hypothetical protein